MGPQDPNRRRGDLADYVLSDFGKQEASVVRELLTDLASLTETWMSSGADAAMNRFNRAGKREGDA